MDDPHYSAEQQAVINRVLAPNGSADAAKMAVVIGNPGTGKAQPLDTPVMTPTGPRPLGDLAEGDEVCDPVTGGAAHVVGAFPQGRKPIFRIMFSDGSSTRCCAEHLWTVNTSDRMLTGMPSMLWPTSKIMDHMALGGLAVRIPLTKPLELGGVAYVQPPIDPWLVGVLCARTRPTRKGVLVVKADLLAEGIRDRLPPGTRVARSFGTSWRIYSDGPNPIRAAMEVIGILGVPLAQRRLPESCLIAPVAVRLAALRGLMDASGAQKSHGMTILRHHSRALAEQAIFIAQSLGGHGTLELDSRRDDVDAYRATIRTIENPFLARSASWRRGKRLPERRISYVEPEGEAECACIKVDTPYGLYLADQLVVTHNTTISKAMMDGFAARWGRDGVVALSPTGKAAKRFAEVTGHACSTIHRALMPWERSLKEGHPWCAGIGIPSLGALRTVLVDEASMIDQQLFLRLLKALPAWVERLILVGDADQLPSVGNGCVLRDTIVSGRIPVFRLTHVYRQGENSWIRTNTQRINRGEMPIADPASTDWFEIMCADIPAAIDRVVDLAKANPDAQILTPTHRGPLGAENLNRLVREAVNPEAGRKGWTAGDITFRRGDRVIHVKNDYDRDVFNGEVGVVIGPVQGAGETEDLAVDYDGRKVTYDEDAAKNALRLAFALTIHKSQGSEYEGVIAILHSTHTFLLSRQLAYVAASRARSRAWIVGDEKGVQRAVRNNQTVERRTRLAERIREAFDAEGSPK